MQKYIIVSIGDTSLPGTTAIGGDKRLAKLGMKAEVVDRFGPLDGGPELIAVCPSVEAAERIRRALSLSDCVD